MNPKRGPLNEPNSPEEVTKSDRYLVEDKTQDRHIQEAFDVVGMEHLYKTGQINEEQLMEMHRIYTMGLMFKKLGI